MKKSILGTLLFGLILTGCSKDEEDNNNDNNNNVENYIIFNDSQFKEILVADSLINTNFDNEITEEEAEAFTGIISAPNEGLTDVTELKYFPNVTRISLFGNNLTSIDVSHNTKVTQLLLEDNKLTSIDVSALSLLTDLKCHSNKLVEANVANGNNSNVTRVQFQVNPDLTCITVDDLADVNSNWLKDNTAVYSTNCN